MHGDDMTMKMILDGLSESLSRVLYLGTHHYTELSNSNDLLEYDPEKLSALRYIIPTGACIPDAYIANYQKKLPNFIGIWNGYGLTETGMLMVNDNSHSLGKILPGVRLKVRIAIFCRSD